MSNRTATGGDPHPDQNSWFIGRVSAEGTHLRSAQFGPAGECHRTRPGEPYSTTASPGDREREDSADANGLYQSHVEPQYSYDSVRQQVNLTLIVTSGPRARFSTPGSGGRRSQAAAGEDHIGHQVAAMAPAAAGCSERGNQSPRPASVTVWTVSGRFIRRTTGWNRRSRWGA